MNKMSIAIIKFNYLPLSETFIYEGIARLKKYRPVILCKVKENTGAFGCETLHSQFSSHPFRKLCNDSLKERFFKNTCFNVLFGNLSFFEKYIDQYRIRLLHAMFPHEGIYTLPLKRKYGIPLVVSFHGGYSSSVSPFIHKPWFEKLFAAADLCTVPSRYTQNTLERAGCPPEKIRIHHCGVDITKIPFKPRIYRNSNEPVRFLTVGRIVEKKGLADIIEAFSLSHRKHRNIRLDIIGDSAPYCQRAGKNILKRIGLISYAEGNPLYKEKVKAMVQQLGIAHAVHFHGALRHREVIKKLSEAHIFLLSSHRSCDGDEESLPVALLEAQANGMPVIATDHAGISEGVRRNRSAYLVAERNPAELSNRINHLIEHPYLWPQIGTAGREYVSRNFHIGDLTEKIESIYGTLIQRYNH